MDMAKYVAVGVLAIVVLAAVTHQGPPGEQAAQADGVVQASFGGGATGPEAAPTPGPLDPLAAELPLFEPPPPEPVVEVAPVASAGPALPAPGELVEYTVQAGQTLSDVARELLGDGGRWRELHRHNQAVLPDPNLVRAGIKLTFPRAQVAAKTAAKGGASAPATAEPCPAALPGGRSYKVERGDTLYSIARKQLGQGSRWREIMTLNRLGSEQVAAGTVLALPQ